MEYLHAPLATFVTWSTYGTHLHGDVRGSVDEGYNRFGTPQLPRNSSIREFEEERMRWEPFVLSSEMREVVDAVIRAHCEIRGWRLLALNVRTNHVHVVLVAPVHPDVIESQLKAWGTRRLREAGLVDRARPVWTRRGSGRLIWSEEGLAGAVHYVLNCQ